MNQTTTNDKYSLAERLKRVKKTRWIRFSIVALLYIGWTIWLNNYYVLFGLLLLIDIYLTQYIPWGWWKPVAAKAVARYPQVTRNRHFKRDMFNVAIGIVWQCCLTIVPMYLVVRGTGGLIASVLLLVVTTVVLKYTWYRPLCREEKEYDELMKRIGMD